MFFAIYDTATGRLVSTASGVRLPLPAGRSYVQLDDKPPESHEWDAATRTFVPRQGAPDIDLVDEIMAHPLMPRILTTLVKDQVRSAVAAILDQYQVRIQ